MSSSINSNNLPKNNTPIGGNLGILAYGYRGIMIWRQARQSYVKEQLEKQQKVVSEEK